MKLQMQNNLPMVADYAASFIPMFDEIADFDLYEIDHSLAIHSDPEKEWEL